jgi:hypothetical protein
MQRAMPLNLSICMISSKHDNKISRLNIDDGGFINLLPIALVGLFIYIYFCNVMFINCAKNTNNISARTLFVNVKYSLCRIKK